ncbi:uncharacterized protein LOC123518914 [Portunus trituberculatus]|uniref:uncharacterized protein LOC123518914 n=1 Tax=Portunus trituberculatus TaxID=210409 RepID=UPI001E1CD5E3|nr:uncharacterized protein LOC123518914 [Portunus trituberculatus]
MARHMPPLSLLLLLGTLVSGLVQGSDCNKGSETVKEGYSNIEEGGQIYEGYLKVGKDFNGVSLEVRGTNDSKHAWFPKEPCFPHTGRWTQIVTKMKVEHNKTTMTLNSGDCRETCTINSTLSGKFIVVPYGSGLWRVSPPEKDCVFENLMPHPSNKLESTCKERTSTATAYTYSKWSSTLPLWAIALVGVLLVAVVGTIVVFVQWKYHTSRNATNVFSEFSEPHNSPRVIKNDDVYEALDYSAIKHYQSSEATHWNSKTGLSPVQGEQPCTIENELYESFSRYKHRQDQ